MSVSISPPMFLQFFNPNNSGAPAAGYKLFTYIAGTSTKQATWTDSTQTVQNSNPIILDSSGGCYVWGDPSLVYKYVWTSPNDTDPPTSPIRTVDNIQFSISAQILYPQTPAEVAAGITPTNYLYPPLDVRRYGAACNGVTNDATALHSADLVAAGTSSIICQPTMFIGTATTVSSPIADTMAQLFTTNSQVTLSGANFVRPEWFGSAAGNIRLAVVALPSTGGTIKLERKVYPASFNTTPAITNGTGNPLFDYMGLNAVTFDCAGAPEYNSTQTAFLPNSGTIITGPFRVWASGFKILKGMGVDSSAAPNDAFFFYQPNEGSPTYAQGVHIDSIRGLGNGPTVAYHACLIEGATQVTVNEAQGANCGHGVVNKSKDAQWGIVKAYLNQLEGFVFKADAYAQAHDCQVGEIQVQGDSGVSNYGVLIEGVGATGDKCQIGRVFVTNCTYGVNITNGGNAISDVQIGELISDGNTVAVQIDNVQRCQIGKVIANNGTYGVFTTSNQGSKDVRINELICTNLSGAGDAVYVQGPIRIGNITINNITGYVFHYPNLANAAIQAMFDGSLNQITTPGSGFSNFNSTLVNSWVSFGSGNSPWAITLASGKVRFAGLIKSGTSATVTTLSPPLVPATSLRLTGLAYNGTVWTPAEILITAGTGVVSVTNYTAGSDYISFDNVEFPIPY